MNFKNILSYLVVFIVAVYIFGCGGAPSGGGTVDENVVVAEIKLVTASSQLGFNQDTKIDVYLYTQSGALYKGEKTVIFSLDKPSVASVDPTAFTLSDGHGKVTFRSRDTKGYVVITAAVDGVQTQITIAISDSALPSEMTLTANPNTIYAGGTTSIRAELKDSNGLPVENGTIVSFTLGDSTIGDVTASAATSNGVALATFSSSGKAGFAKITAKVGTLSKDIDIEVKAAEVNSIIFIEATPQVVSIQGTGKVTTSTITFNVLDSNGDNVSQAVEVLMTLDGPGGGEFLGTEPGTKSLKVNTVNGVASVLLNSGTVPGTVTITAQIVGTDIKSSSGVIAIGGGVPAAGRFSLSTAKFNYEGLIYDGVKGDLNVLLADRYGNTNILANTVVKFFSECGGIEPAAILDATGSGKVEFRTQRPVPYLVKPSSTSNRQILEAEYDYLNWFDSVFRTNYASLSNPEYPNPRDGFCTITSEYTLEDNTTKSCLVNVSPKVTYTYGGGTVTENGAIYLTAPCAPNGN